MFSLKKLILKLFKNFLIISNMTFIVIFYFLFEISMDETFKKIVFLFLLFCQSLYKTEVWDFCFLIFKIKIQTNKLSKYQHHLKIITNHAKIILLKKHVRFISVVQAISLEFVQLFQLAESNCFKYFFIDVFILQRCFI